MPCPYNSGRRESESEATSALGTAPIHVTSPEKRPFMKPTLFHTVLLIVALASLLGACGDSEPASPAPASSPTPSIPEIVEIISRSVVHIQTEAVQLDQFNRPVPGGGVGWGPERSSMRTDTY